MKGCLFLQVIDFRGKSLKTIFIISVNFAMELSDLKEQFMLGGKRFQYKEASLT